MRIVLLILFLVMMLPFVADSQIASFRYENPGAMGMQSNFGIHTLNPTLLYWGYNIDTWSTPGVIQRRKGIQNYGNNSVALYGAYGYYNGLLQHSMLVGVGAHDSIYAAGQIRISDTTDGSGSVSGLQQDSVKTFLLGGNIRHDWTPVGNNLLHCDGVSIPVIFTTGQIFKEIDSVLDSTITGEDFWTVTVNDTNGYEPHLVSMGIEAPGQLRAIVFDTAGDLNGHYQYALASVGRIITGVSTAWNCDSISESGPLSVTVFPRSQRVHLSLFPHAPPSVCYYSVGTRMRWDFPTTSKMLLLRKKNDGGGDWHVLDTLLYTHAEQLQYIDSIGDTVSTKFRATCWNTYIAPRPGSFRRLNVTHIVTDTGGWRLAYSYYDPETGIESPMGPTIAVGGSGDSIIANISKGWTDTKQRPKQIRLYQTTDDVTMPGGGDTTVFWGTYNMWSNLMLQSNEQYLGTPTVESFIWDSLVLGDSVITGITWDDSQVVNGVDSADYAARGNIYDYNIFRSTLGDVVVKPPYIYDCQVPFSDMEYVNNRVFGIGDPIAPEILYYSEPNTWYTNVWNWPPFNYLEINEGVTGKLIALERAEGYGRDALYVFKRNAIYLVDFSSGSSVQLIESDKGAVSRETCVKYGKAVYFLAPDLHIYRLYGQNVEDISLPVRNWIDTLFTSEIDAAEDGIAFRLGECVKWMNGDSSDGSGGLGLSYHVKSGTWSMESYGDDSTYIPRGTFTYDSTSGGIMSGFPTTVMFDDAAVPLRVEADSATMRTDWAKSRFPCYVQFPFEGDGTNLWNPASMQLTIDLDARSKLYYKVVNERDDSTTSGVVDISGTSTSDVKVDFAEVTYLGIPSSKYLSLRLHLNPLDSFYAEETWFPYWNQIKIKDVVFDIRKMGKSNVQ